MTRDLLQEALEEIRKRRAADDELRAKLQRSLEAMANDGDPKVAAKAKALAARDAFKLPRRRERTWRR